MSVSATIRRISGRGPSHFPPTTFDTKSIFVCRSHRRHGPKDKADVKEQAITGVDPAIDQFQLLCIAFRLRTKQSL
jgi:hypothetical protein